MPLFHVQDDDRPGYVVANDYAEAIRKWSAAVLRENDDVDTGPPRGVSIVCDDRDLIVFDDWLKPLGSDSADNNGIGILKDVAICVLQMKVMSQDIHSRASVVITISKDGVVVPVKNRTGSIGSASNVVRGLLCGT